MRDRCALMSRLYKCRFVLLPLLMLAAPAARGQVLWANSGQDKVALEELRATADPQAVLNSRWDGTTIRLVGARNETVAFTLVIEAPTEELLGVSVAFDTLTGPGGQTIQSVPASGNGVFSWVDRPIEVFFLRSLRIEGVGRLVYNHYDERHVPERFRRPWTGEGYADQGTGWVDRPDHDRHYPDIAVPIELVGDFDIPVLTSRSIWVDVYIPRDTPAGRYTGQVTVGIPGQEEVRIPVDLEVMPFTLPDVPSHPTMLVLGYGDINLRYLGEPWPYDPPLVEQSRLIRDRHFQLAHRHRISLIDSDPVPDRDGDLPRPSAEWEDRLDGSLFTPARGYDGPGVGVGNGIYSVGLYGGWWLDYPDMTEAEMWARTDAWMQWFDTHSPETEVFLYIVDESEDPESLAKIELWSGWMADNPGPGRRMLSFATLDYITGLTETPSLQIPCAAGYAAPADEVEAAALAILDDPDKRLWWYNGWRPYCGSFATEDDGVALLVNAWAHHKKGIQRWFVWESTYYDNFQGGTGQTNVFQSAFTFGVDDGFDPVFGHTGWNYSNGDGVLFYPGTDLVYPAESYGVAGPFASLRLKLWRRGLQDGDYLAMAQAFDPAATEAIVAGLIPEVLWEYGIENPDDPTYVLTDISWPTDPDMWEAARQELVGLILCGRADRTEDGLVDTRDLLDMLAAHAAGDPDADFNADGLVDTRDILAFLTVMAGGC